MRRQGARWESENETNMRNAGLLLLIATSSCSTTELASPVPPSPSSDPVAVPGRGKTSTAALSLEEVQQRFATEPYLESRAARPLDRLVRRAAQSEAAPRREQRTFSDPSMGEEPKPRVLDALSPRATLPESRVGTALHTPEPRVAQGAHGREQFGARPIHHLRRREGGTGAIAPLS